MNFRGLALFGDTRYDQKFSLEYVTIEGYSHFRNATFVEGLNLDYANIQNEMNFFGSKKLDTKKSKNATSQETYRIIKNNFEKLKNTIEANKYHALELSKHRHEIYNEMLTGNLSIQLFLSGIVSFFHWISSNYSQNWLLTLFWIFMVSILTNLQLGHELSVECIFRYVNILSSIDDFDDSYFAMTLNKVPLGYLYYQFLTAVRRDTRK